MTFQRDAAHAAQPDNRTTPRVSAAAGAREAMPIMMEAPP